MSIRKELRLATGKETDLRDKKESRNDPMMGG